MSEKQLVIFLNLTELHPTLKEEHVSNFGAA